MNNADMPRPQVFLLSPYTLADLRTARAGCNEQSKGTSKAG